MDAGLDLSLRIRGKGVPVELPSIRGSRGLCRMLKRATGQC